MNKFQEAWERAKLEAAQQAVKATTSPNTGGSVVSTTQEQTTPEEGRESPHPSAPQASTNVEPSAPATNVFDQEDEDEEEQYTYIDGKRVLKAKPKRPYNRKNVALGPRFHLYPRVMEPECKVCQMSETDRQHLETLYIANRRMLDMKFSVPKSHLNKHAWSMGWREVRDANTQTALAKMHAKGLKALKDDQTKVDPELLLKVVQHIDKREGRIVDRVQQESYQVVFQTSVPLPPPARSSAAALEKRKNVPLLTASQLVLDDNGQPSFAGDEVESE